MAQKTIMIMAGGTGGHVFPGIALAKNLTDKGIKVVWLGTLGGMEKHWVEQEKIPFYKISIKGLRGNGLIGWLKAPVNVVRAWWQARKIMKSIQPDLVLGMGGFVCGPGGIAAKSLKISLVLHEQNAIPGLTNKLLAPFAKQVLTAFPQKKITGEKVLQVGNPIRLGLEDLPKVQAQAPFKILVLGGSRGALALNEKIPQALALLPISKRPEIIHQTGKEKLQQTKEFYLTAEVKAQVVPFIDDMVAAYSQADLVICRAGALTISELIAAARPAIMIPFPYAADDHQTANAKVLVGLQGGEIALQKDLTPEALAKKIHYWLDRKRLQLASDRIREKSFSQYHQATENITKILLQHLQKEVS